MMEQKWKELSYILFLYDNRYGSIKDISFTDGNYQHVYKIKDETRATTVTIDGAHPKMTTFSTQALV